MKTRKERNEMRRQKKIEVIFKYISKHEHKIIKTAKHIKYSKRQEYIGEI